MIDAFNTSTGRSYSTDYKFPDFVLPGTYDDGFDINLMVKDIGCALDLAESTGSPFDGHRGHRRQCGRRRRSCRRTPTTPTIAEWIDEARGG